MAQASSAQREPSMEEILASIRKIIEDGETANKPATPSRGAAEPESSVERDSATVLDVGSFRATRDATDFEKSAEPESTEPVADPYGLAADISDVGYDDHHHDHDNEPVSEAPSAYQHPEPEPEAQFPASAQADLEPEIASEPEWQLSNFANLLDEELKRSPMMESDGDNTLRPAIMSDSTQRQVAASFGELSEAFAVSRQKSFDEMAEEMIRPMLQDWLDNNLPTLVERLVREEIERIARGPAA